jgi:hypothetical protein
MPRKFSVWNLKIELQMPCKFRSSNQQSSICWCNNDDSPPNTCEILRWKFVDDSSLSFEPHLMKKKNTNMSVTLCKCAKENWRKGQYICKWPYKQTISHICSQVYVHEPRKEKVYVHEHPERTQERKGHINVTTPLQVNIQPHAYAPVNEHTFPIEITVMESN